MLNRDRCISVLTLAWIFALSPPLCAAGPATQRSTPVLLGQVGLRSGRPWAFTPDSKGLFTQDENGINLWETATGKSIRSFGGANQFMTCAISPDGSTIAACVTNHVTVWNVASGAQIATLGQGPGYVSNPALSTDGKLIAWITSGAEKISIRTVATGKEIALLPVDEKEGHPFMLRFSPDGTLLAEGGSGVVMNNNLPKGFSTVRIWDIAAKRRTLQAKFDESSAPSIAFSPDGKRMVSSGSSLRLWDIPGGRELASLAPDGSSRGHLTFTDDGKSIVCIGMAPDAVWMTQKFAVADTGFKALFTTRLDQPASALSDDGRYVAFGGSAAGIVETSTGKPFGVEVGPTSVTRAAAFIGDGSSVVTVCEDGMAFVWETATGKLLKRVELHVPRVESAAISRDGSTVAVTDDMRIYGIDMATGAQLYATRPNIGRRVTLAAMSPDGNRVAAAGRLFDMQMHWGWFVWGSHVGGAPRIERALPAMFASGICWSPSGNIVAIGCGDGTVRLFHADTGNEQITLKIPGDEPAAPMQGRGFRTSERSILSIDISPDGHLLAASMYNHDLALWDTASGKLIRLLPKVTPTIPRVLFDPRGFALATMENNGDITFFEAATGLKITRLQCRRTIDCWNFSPDGQWIVTGGEPRDNVVWKSPLNETSRPAAAGIDQSAFEKLWAEMAAADAGRAFAAASKLATGGAPALKFLADHLLWPAPAPEQRASIAAMIDGLSADEFRARRNAEQQLRQTHGAARPQMIEAMKNPRSIDARLAMDRLLGEDPPAANISPEDARFLRAIAAIEQIGGAEAAAILQKVWDTSTSNAAAAEARAALLRLHARGVGVSKQP